MVYYLAFLRKALLCVGYPFVNLKLILFRFDCRKLWMSSLQFCSLSRWFWLLFSRDIFGYCVLLVLTKGKSVPFAALAEFQKELDRYVPLRSAGSSSFQEYGDKFILEYEFESDQAREMFFNQAVIIATWHHSHPALEFALNKQLKSLVHFQKKKVAVFNSVSVGASPALVVAQAKRYLRAGKSVRLGIDGRFGQLSESVDLFGGRLKIASGVAMLSDVAQVPVLLASAYSDPEDPARVSISVTGPYSKDNYQANANFLQSLLSQLSSSLMQRKVVLFSVAFLDYVVRSEEFSIEV
ncbi:hypothetical protein GW915_13605 [bacterium]|nr:hypothetical protein [bacterium]